MGFTTGHERWSNSPMSAAHTLAVSSLQPRLIEWCGRRFPARLPSQHGSQLPDHSLRLRIRLDCQIPELHGITVVIVKFSPTPSLRPLREPPVVGANAATHHRVGELFVGRTKNLGNLACPSHLARGSLSSGTRLRPASLCLASSITVG